jgi:hypothetical protein
MALSFVGCIGQGVQIVVVPSHNHLYAETDARRALAVQDVITETIYSPLIGDSLLLLAPKEFAITYFNHVMHSSHGSFI